MPTPWNAGVHAYMHAHPQQQWLHTAWPRLIAAAAFTFMRRIQKLPMVLGRHTVSLQK